MKRGPKFKRQSSTRQRFLQKRGLSKTPRGKEVVHKRSLWKGGTDTTRNLSLRKKTSHRKQTSREARQRAKRR
jgi:hypothetical protein